MLTTPAEETRGGTKKTNSFSLFLREHSFQPQQKIYGKDFDKKSGLDIKNLKHFFIKFFITPAEEEEAERQQSKK